MILLETLLAGLEARVRAFAVCSIERAGVLPPAATDLATLHDSLSGTAAEGTAGRDAG